MVPSKPCNPANVSPAAAGRFSPVEQWLLLVFAALLLFLCVKNSGSHDMWWHLKQGEYTITQWRLPAVDVFSHTFQNRPVYNFSFLFDVYIALVKSGFGWPGVFLLPALLLTLSFIVTVSSLRRLVCGGFALPIGLVFLFYLPVGYYLTYRGDMFSILFFVVFFVTLQRFHATMHAGALPVLLATLLVWSQIHAFPIAWGLLGLSFVSWLRAFLRRRISWQQLRFIGLGYCFIALTPALNPFVLFTGNVVRLLPGALNPYRSSGFFYRLITEWKPVLQGDMRGWFVTLCLLLLLALAANRRRLDLFSAMCALMCVLMAYRHQRTINYLFVFTPFLLVPALAPLARAVRRKGRKYMLLLFAVFFIGIGIVSVRVVHTLRLIKKRNLTIRANDGLHPLSIPDVLKYNRLKGNLFNKYEAGGYLLYHLFPENHVFIDGRTNILYDKLFFWSFIASKENRDVFTVLHHLYPFDIAIISSNQYQAAWKEYLDADFFFFYQDLSYLLFLRKEAFAELHEKSAFSWIAPGVLNDPARFVRHLDDPVFVKDIAMLKRIFPPGYYANLLTYLRLLDQGQGGKAARSMSRIRPYLEYTRHCYHFHISMAHFHLYRGKDYTQALRHITQAAKLGMYPAKTAYLFATAYHRQGNEGRAAACFERYFSLVPDALDELAFVTVANYALKQRDYAKAKRFLGRYYFLRQGRVHERVLRMLLFSAYQSRDYALINRVLSLGGRAIDPPAPALNGALRLQ